MRGIRDFLAATTVIAGVVLGCNRAAAPPTEPIIPEGAPEMDLTKVDPSQFRQVSAAVFHSCGVTWSGKAYCWGLNDEGELGDGSNDDSNVPVAVVSGSRTGNLVFKSVSAGLSHSCGVTRLGKAYCWGDNDYGQLGEGSNIESNVPVPVATTLSFKAVTVGLGHNCGITSLGKTYCWGSNISGQLGDGSNIDSNVPVPVATTLSFAAVSAGGVHSCAVTTGHRLYCWGRNVHGQLGDGSRDNRSVPVVVATTRLFTSVTTGTNHSCGITTLGKAYCWGSNTHGELGDRSTEPTLVPVAVAAPISRGTNPLVPTLSFLSLSAGLNHTCGVSAGGVTYCWGLNDSGQLGDGTNTERHRPTRIQGFQFTAVEAGASHTCGVTSTGAYCWGYNAQGQLGNGTNTLYSNVPVAVVEP